MTATPECRCTSFSHGHPAGGCQQKASRPDGLCESCHNLAAAETAATIVPLSEPVRLDAQSLQTLTVTFSPVAFRVEKLLPDDHPFYQLFGRVAAEWALIEHVLDLTIWELAGFSHELGSCITGQLIGQSGRFNALLALVAAKGCDDKMRNRITDLVYKTGNLAKRRNRFVHDAWYLSESESGKSVGQFKSYEPKIGKSGFDEVTETFAIETIDPIKSKLADISQLRADLLKALSSAWRRRDGCCISSYELSVMPSGLSFKRSHRTHIFQIASGRSIWSASSILIS
jgi:hypothetical protein